MKGEVELTKPAKEGGEKGELETSDSKTASAPSFIIVPAGQKKAFFRIHTSNKVAKAKTVRIHSKLNGKTLEMSLHVRN